MKLFHWDNVDYLRECTPGNVVIIANSLDEALEVFEKQWPECPEILLDELKATQPTVIEKPYALFFNGEG